MTLFNGLLKRGKPSSGSTLMSIETAHKVVREYGHFLETSAPLPGCVADVNQLPHSKEYIKAAIRVCVNKIRVPEVIEELKSGYLMLSAWQNDVGEQTLGLDFTQLDLDEDPMLVAQMIHQQNDSIGRWKPMIAADQITLMSEFVKMEASA